MANERLIEVISPQSYEAIQQMVNALGEAFDLTVRWNKELKDLRNMKPSEIQRSFTEASRTIREAQKAINDYEKQERALENAQKRRMQASNSLTRETQKLRFETQQLNRQAREEGILTSKLATEYQKLEVRYNQVGRQIQSLVAKKELNGRLSKQEDAELKKLEKQYQKYQSAILNADKAIGRHNRNVGNYKSAITGLTNSLGNLVRAFGLVGGIYLFANAVRDAFRRVKEFDNSMQNLAGVMRTTRSDLKDLERNIIAIAGRSVRTSSEVAKLAETLATLGKTKDEISELLEPVINLSLGLNASADEAGEFLIQMLNTFGKGTDSAAEFADTIATIRTSTTLDFQKMRDSFAYIAPISALLNKDLAHTGALVGVLADNGIKAESAGRLLSTSMINLAANGVTLEEALGEINQAISSGASELEVLTVASNRFGAQASKIGVVLAKNKDKINELTDAIRGNSGALDDLVEQQLESLENKLKILDSAYEEFIISLENGNGALAKSFGVLVDAGTKFLNMMTELNKSQGDVLAEVRTKQLKEQAERYKDLGDEAKAYAEIERRTAEQNIENLKKQYQQAKENLELAQQTKPILGGIFGMFHRMKLGKAENELDRITRALYRQQTTLMGVNNLLNEYNDNFPGKDGEAQKQVRRIASIRAEIKSLRDTLEELDVTDKEGIRTTQNKIEVLQKELDAILGISKAQREQIKILSGTVAHFNEQIRKLEELRDKTAKTRAEYAKFNSQILNLTRNVEILNGEWEAFLRSMTESPVMMGKDDIVKALQISTKEAMQELSETADELSKKEAEAEKRRRASAYSAQMIKEAWVSLGETIGLSTESLEDFFDLARSGFKDLDGAITNFADLATQSLSLMAKSQNKRYQEQLDRLQKERDIQIAYAGESAAARVEIEERFQRREAQIKRRMAQNEKRAAVISSIINTAAAVTKTFATLGWPAGILAASIIAGLGAAQTAIIASQPIPQFKEGVRDFEGGLAVVGDGGKREPITDSKGQLIGVSPDRPTLVNLPKGSNVYKDRDSFEKELNQMLNLNGISPLGSAINSPIVVIEGGGSNGLTESQMKKVMKETLGSMPKNVISIDENGIKKYAKKQYSKGISLNNRVTFKGMDV